MTQNDVYDYVYEDVIAAFPTSYISGVYEPLPPSFPAVFIREIGRRTVEANVTFSGSQGVKDSTFEVQIQSNDPNAAKTEAYEIMQVVEQSFEKLFYIQTAMNPIEGDTYRLVATFRRVIGSADEMPEG